MIPTGAKSKSPATSPYAQVPGLGKAVGFPHLKLNLDGNLGSQHDPNPTGRTSTTTLKRKLEALSTRRHHTTRVMTRVGKVEA
jgi:hypothetical protein